MDIHFVHIGKTGGSSIKMALRECQFKIGATSLHVYGHDITLRSIVELRPNDKAFFVIRDPISLLISGFNSRLRQGMPRHHRPWTKYEDAFFGHFGNVSQFISALIDPTHPHHQVAFLGMANSIHTGRRLSHYVVSRRLSIAIKHTLIVFSGNLI